MNLSPHINYFLCLLFLLFFAQCKTESVKKIVPVKIPSYDYNVSEFQVIGHRGFSDIYPENTLLAIEEVFKRGVKYCEIDVNVTSDDVYVLFHDQPTMYRTSNGNNYIVASTYKELLELDFGSWKGEQFKNTKIATLEEALILAEKYDAFLYLDTKKIRVDLMGKALANTKVDPKRLMPAIATINEAKEFKKYCPNSPFVYFGGMPKDPNDDNWYKEYIDLGCEFFETYYTFALDNDDNFKTFVTKVHENNAKVWVFTSNDIVEIKKIKENNVDGVESDLSASAFKSLKGNKDLQIKPLKATTGNWTFENDNLQSTGIGSQLRPFNYFEENYQDVIYGTTSSFEIDFIEKKDTKVIKIPAFNPKNGLFIFTNFTPFKNENHHFNYSLIMDLYIPEESENKFISLYQTSPTNSNDGDLFINNKGVGVDNEYHGKFLKETWYRLCIVVSENSIKKYINGSFVGKQSISSGRWSVYNTFAGGQDQGFLLFADNDNETAPLFLSSLQLRNYSMNPNEIKLLGGVKSNGIAISNSGIYDLKFENEIKKSIVNWDLNEIYVYLSDEVKSTKDIRVWFKLPFGAKSNVQSGDEIRFKETIEQTISVTAQDGVSRTDWKVILKNED
jgi:glycerophosphoryl diester phosphodiesterase